MDQALCLCYAAHKYDLPDLVAKCLHYVEGNLSPEYTFRVLEFIKLFDEEENIKVILFFIHFSAVYLYIYYLNI